MNLTGTAKKFVPLAVRRRMLPMAKFVYRKDLSKLATLYETDKWGFHWYMQHYQRYFQPLRKKPLNLLEIGVGGEDDPRNGGQSLRTWKRFFPRARIVGIDIFDKRHFSQARIDVRICDQTDEAALRKLSAEYGGFDIIIDDGSHMNEHVIKTFHVLFPLLRPNGIYAIEDTQTSYWPSFGGGLDKPGTMLDFFKRLTDGLNYMEYSANPGPEDFERNIVEIAFFHNLVIIRKGTNEEKSNLPHLVQSETGREKLVSSQGAGAN